MDCKKCGTPAVDGAVYCYNCGERVDGKKTCPTCGKLNDQAYKYCIYCGTRTDGKTVCKGCGTEHEGAFCPNCGIQSAQKKQTKKCVQKVHNCNTYAGVMRIVALSLGMLAALSAFIFMFFIGFEANDKGKTIFYYFLDIFHDLKAGKESGGLFKGAIKALSYFYVITSCIIAAATLIGCITFFLLATVRFVKSLFNVQTRSPLSMALWTVFTYILGASLLYPLGAGDAGRNSMGYNVATLVGLIVSFILLVATVVCMLLCDLKKFKKKTFVIRLVCSGICIMFGAVAFFMVRNAGMKSAEYVSRIKEEAEGSPGVISGGILGLFASMYHDKTALKFEMNMISLFGIIGTVFVFIAIIFTLLALFKNVRNLLGESRKTDVVSPIVSAVLSIGVLICCILIWKEAALIVNTTKPSYESVSLGLRSEYTGSILAIIFTTINLGCAIVNKIISRKGEVSDEK